MSRRLPRGWAAGAAAAAAHQFTGTKSAPRLINESENWTYVLDNGISERTILRVYRPGARTDEQIRSELAWMRALSDDTELEVPPVLGADGSDLVTVTLPSGPPAQCVAFGMVEGRETTDSELPAMIGELGRLTALLHRHGRQWARPTTFNRPAWDLDTTIGRKAHWGKWTAGVTDPDERRQLRRVAKLIRQRLELFGRNPERFGLIHADLRLSNVLQREQAPILIDFDDSGEGWYLYDLATTLTFNEAAPEREAMIASWLDGYREVSPLGSEDEAEIFTFLMLRRLMSSAWFGSHSDTDIARELQPGFAAETCGLAETYLDRFT